MNLFSDSYQQFFDEEAMFQKLQAYIDPDIRRWHPFCRAQYLEMILFLSGHLLSSQGDRMMMGHSVEGRFPFLDYRVIEFANTIPPRHKMQGLNEKYILKKAYADLLPESVIKRTKQPYRAPISRCFLQDSDSLASSMLSADNIRKFGYFAPDSVDALLNKSRNINGGRLSERDDMATVSVVSMQLLHHHFISAA
jgi:asparagine synthase (glutamine-hydrolysing)